MLDSAKYKYEETIKLLGKVINISITKESFASEYVAVAYFLEDKDKANRYSQTSTSKYKEEAKNRAIISLVHLDAQKDYLE